MKKILTTAVLGLSASLLCAVLNAAPQRTVRIYNWIEYLPPQILADFENETGIHPIYDVFDSVEVLESKLLTGNSGYDVAFPSSSNIDKLIHAGAFEPLDRSQLPNWQHLDSRFMQTLEAAGDPGNQYVVPYMWGTTLIGYNVDKVRAVLGDDFKLDSWDMIFKPENLAKLHQCGVGFLDAGNEILPIALHYLGLNANSQSPADYEKAKALMLSIRPSVTYFNSSRYGMDLANGDICVGVGWSGGVELARKLADAAGKGVKVQMFIPKEGVPMWSDVMVIPKNAPDRAEAQAFINYMRRPDVIAKASNAIGYPNPNKDATLLVDASIRDNPNMYVPQQQLGLLYPLEPIPMAIERIRTRTWTAVRSGN